MMTALLDRRQGIPDDLRFRSLKTAVAALLWRKTKERK